MTAEHLQESEEHPQEPNESSREPKDEGVPPRVLLFFDYACPFCYVDQFRFDKLRGETEAEFLLIPFELRPDMPAEGWQTSELEAIGASDRVEEHLMRIAAKDGFPMQNPPFLPNTHKALVIGEMGRERGETEHWAIHHALFGAYFADGMDIGDEGVLLDIARAGGYSGDDVRQAWESGTYDEQLEQFRHLGIHMGIDSTPAALICNELFIGSRPYKVFRDALDRCMVTPDNVEEVAGAE